MAATEKRVSSAGQLGHLLSVEASGRAPWRRELGMCELQSRQRCCFRAEPLHMSVPEAEDKAQVSLARLWSRVLGWQSVTRSA